MAGSETGMHIDSARHGLAFLDHQTPLPCIRLHGD